MSQTYQSRLKILLEDPSTGREIASHIKRLPGVKHILGPLDIMVGQNERRSVQLPGPLQAIGSPPSSTATCLILTTDTPGVRYCLSEEAPSDDRISTGVFLDGSETVRQQDFQASQSPVYGSGGNWLNHNTGVGGDITQDFYPFILRFKTEDGDGPVTSGGIQMKLDSLITGGGSLARINTRYVWGRNNQIDLGAEDDCMVLDFWFYRLLNKTGAGQVNQRSYLKFGSYPYTTATREEDLADTDGDEDDSEYLFQSCPPSGTLLNGNAEAHAGAYFYFEFDSAAFADDNSWVHVQLRKSDFTEKTYGGESPDWRRITWFEIYDGSAVLSAYMRFSDFIWVPEGAGWRYLDLVACEQLHWDDHADYPEGRDRTQSAGVHLTLRGPANHHAKVQAYLGVV